jgi:Xaa-Pro aminopeptidase
VTSRWHEPGDRPPFSTSKLDALLDRWGIDGVLAVSAHNTRYLLGGYRFFLYDRSDAIGTSRYLPVVGYVRGRADQSFYVGARIEDWGTDVFRPWVPEIATTAWGTVEAADVAAGRLRDRGLGAGTIGIEPAHLPADAMDALTRALPRGSFVDASELLDELRAVKSAHELHIIRCGSAAVVEAMLATFAALDAGSTTNEAVEILRQEETRRGLTFAFGLAASGAHPGRAPCARRIGSGAGLSLDSGAELSGYFADVARMGIAGEPTERHLELLAEVEAVQEAARRAVAPGRRGGEVPDAARACLSTLPDAHQMWFQVHGTGLLTHEAPRLMDDAAPPYPATHRERPLEAGMVLSIETHVNDAELGFIKLEDTVLVMPNGHEAVADDGRAWNKLGAAGLAADEEMAAGG